MTISIFHLLWIVPVAVIFGFTIAAILYVAKRSDGDDLLFDDWEEWEE